MTLFTIANVNAIVAFGLLENWVMMAIFCSTLLRNVVLLYLSVKDRHLNRFLNLSMLMFFWALTIIAVVFTYVWWFDWLLLAGSLLAVFGKWMKSNHLIKFTNLPWSILAIINNVFFYNFMGIAIEAIVILSVAIFYLRFFRNNVYKTKNCE